MRSLTHKTPWILGASLIGLGVVLGLLALSLSAGKAQSGSSLLLNAAVSSRAASPGNTDIASVYVTVQSSSGLIDGLTESNFLIFAEQLPSQGCLVRIAQIRTERAGIYRLDIVPGVAGCRWRPGDYVLSVSARVGSQSGAALAVMTLR